MTPIRRVLALETSDRWLVWRTFGTLILVRTSLWLLPAPKVYGLLVDRLEGTKRPQWGRPTIDDVAWAVPAVARYVPSASCVVQAFGAARILRRWAYPANVRVGVARGKNGVTAHAWVDSGGQIVVGGAERDEFVELWPGATPTS